MKHFTLKKSGWMASALFFVMSVFSMAANAADDNTAVFDYTKGDIPTLVNGVSSSTTSTFAEGELGNGLQLRDGKTLSFTAPAGTAITSVVLHRAENAPYNFYFLECNEGTIDPLDEGLYIDVEWNGAATNVVFTATVLTAWVATATVTFGKTEGVVSAVNTESQTITYDLTGRRVNAPKQGLFIQNGVKMIR